MRLVNWQMDSIRSEQQPPSHTPSPPPPLPQRAAGATSCTGADGDRPPLTSGCSGGVFRGGQKGALRPHPTLSPSSPSPAMVEPGSAPGILLFPTFPEAAVPEGGERLGSRLGLVGGKMLTHLLGLGVPRPL